MNSAKFNLYNAEWLDLVFDHRNKAYGAYELRQHYSNTMVKAMGWAFAGLAVLIVGSIIFKHKPVVGEKIIIQEVPLLRLPPVKPDEPKIEKYVEPASAKPPVPSTKFLRPVVVPFEPTEEPPAISELKGAVSNETVTSPGTGVVDNVPDIPGNGTGDKPDITESATSNEPFTQVEVMPEPAGGAQAWAKFLQSNLRYPALAREDNITGMVILSFIVEKDGHLSDIKVTRGLGHGLDEESLRVLKLAKPWKPGIQNGHPVRVAYSIPFNFQLAGE